MTKQTHVLKTWTGYWQAIFSGEKTFEVRENDRGYQVGDVLQLVEYDPMTKKTGGVIFKEVSYMLSDTSFPGLKPGYVVMGLKDCEPEEVTEYDYYVLKPCRVKAFQYSDTIPPSWFLDVVGDFDSANPKEIPTLFGDFVPKLGQYIMMVGDSLIVADSQLFKRMTISKDNYKDFWVAYCDDVYHFMELVTRDYLAVCGDIGEYDSNVIGPDKAVDLLKEFGEQSGIELE